MDGIEPTSPAWKAGVLPLYDTRIILSNIIIFFSICEYTKNLYSSQAFFYFFVELRGIEPRSSLSFSMSHLQLSLVSKSVVNQQTHHNLFTQKGLTNKSVLLHTCRRRLSNLFYTRVLNNPRTYA